jgi:hypothetical protein
VLQSNIAACHLKLLAWKEAVKTATEALDRLDKLQDNGVDEEKDKDGEEEADEEIVSAGAQKAEDTSKQGTTEADIERIRTKALLRRARGRSEQGGWSGLQGAEDGMCCLVLWLWPTDMLEDYKTLSQKENLSRTDRRTVQLQLMELPGRIKQAQEAEVGDMMGKLKEVCSLFSFITLYK